MDARMAALVARFLSALGDLLSVTDVNIASSGPLPTGESRPAGCAPALRELIREQLAQINKPISQSGLARRCKKSNSGHFRDTLEEMEAEGKVRRLPTGHYWLPGRTLPSGWQA